MPTPFPLAPRAAQSTPCIAEPEAASKAATTPLSDLAGLAGARVSVEATVRALGELERQELRLQPGEFVTTRTLFLQQGGTMCSWVLWAGDAERYGPELVGRRVLVQGAMVHKFNGRCQLTGCTHVDLLVAS